MSIEEESHVKVLTDMVKEANGEAERYYRQSLILKISLLAAVIIIIMEAIK